MTTKTRQLRNLAAGAIVGLASLLPGCKSGLSEFNPLFRPNEISSTHKQRGHFDFGRQIEKMYESGEKWTLNEKSDTLYVRAENFTEALGEFKIQNNGTYNELFEGARVEIAFDDPRTGKEESEVQIVANDGTIDSKFFGTFNAFATRSQLDDAITKKAREKFGDEDMEVAVRHIAYPMADKADTFLGFGAVNSTHGSLEIIPLLNQPMDSQFAAMAGPNADTKYIAHIKRITNGAEVPKDDPRFVSRVIAYGPTSNFVSGMYADINFGHKDYVVGLGNRPLDNLQAFVGEANETADGFLHMAGAVQQGRIYVDFFGNETVYLESHLANNGKGNKVERATKWLNQTSDLRDAVKRAATPAAGAGQ
jgi:hypothetical protein